MKLLLYGFKPFGQNVKNISEEVVKLIPSAPGLFKHVFSVHFNRDEFTTVVENIKPDLIIGLGQTSTGTKLRVEKTAVNQYGSRREGVFQPIIHGGLALINVSFNLTNSDQTTISHNAGRYVCNYSMYVMSQWANANNAKFCFVHIPKKYPINRVVEYICQELKNQL